MTNNADAENNGKERSDSDYFLQGPMDNDKKRQDLSRRSLGFLIITSICWALPPSLGKLIGSTIPPIFIAWFRLMLASLILLLIIFLNKDLRGDLVGLKKLPKNDKIWMLIAGAFFMGPHYIFYFYSLHYTSALSVAILINLGDIFISLFGFIIFKEKVNKRLIFAMIMAILGILLIITKGDFTQSLGALLSSRNLFGDILIIIAALLFSFYSVVKKKIIHKMNSITFVALTFLFAQLVLFPFAIPSIMDSVSYPAKSFGLLLLITIFGSIIGYLSFAEALRNTASSITGLVLLSSPFFGVTFSIVFVGEHPTIMYILGSSLIILALFFVSSKKS
ncbi:MAG: DMT family transporter [Promethearchaeota archaeon]